MGGDVYRITVDDYNTQEDVRLTKDEHAHPSTTSLGPGIVLELGIGQDCTFESLPGALKMRKVWENESGAQLFECWADISIRYTSLLQSKGYEEGRL